MRRYLVVLLLVSSVFCMFMVGVPFVHADTQVFGHTTGGLYRTGYTAGTVEGNIVNMTAFALAYPAASYTVQSAFAQLKPVTAGPSWVSGFKMLILDKDFNIVAVSEETTTSNNLTYQLYSFTFASPVILYASMANYSIAVISDSTFAWEYNNIAGMDRVEDATNFYAAPTDPTDATRETTYLNPMFYLTVSYNAGSGGGVDVENLLDGIDWAAVAAWIGVLILWLFPVFLLGVVLRGGKWGFLIGLAVGAGLSYLIFPVFVPIWFVVLVAVGLGAAFLTQIRSGG